MWLEERLSSSWVLPALEIRALSIRARLTAPLGAGGARPRACDEDDVPTARCVGAVLAAESGCLRFCLRLLES